VQDTEQRSTGSEQGSLRFIVLNLFAFCFIKQMHKDYSTVGR